MSTIVDQELKLGINRVEEALLYRPNPSEEIDTADTEETLAEFPHLICEDCLQADPTLYNEDVKEPAKKVFVRIQEQVLRRVFAEDNDRRPTIDFQGRKRKAPCDTWTVTFGAPPLPRKTRIVDRGGESQFPQQSEFIDSYKDYQLAAGTRWWKEVDGNHEIAERGPAWQYGGKQRSGFLAAAQHRAEYFECFSAQPDFVEGEWHARPVRPRSDQVYPGFPAWYVQQQLERGRAARGGNVVVELD